MKPDLITCWPCCHDYPLWRAQVTRDRDRFEKVIIVFTSDNIPVGTREFVRLQLPFATFVDKSEGEGGHWYDEALKAGLSVSRAEWVWFTEEDFFYPAKFLDGLFGLAPDYDMVSAEWRSDRTDPSCCLIRRSVVDQVLPEHGFEHRAADPPLDNFDAFAHGVRARFKTVNSRNLGLVGWQHMRGLTQNHFVIEHELWDAVYEPAELRSYFAACLTAGVPLLPRWEQAVARFNAWFDGQTP